MVTLKEFMKDYQAEYGLLTESQERNARALYEQIVAHLKHIDAVNKQLDAKF